jgi:hypothetical protein
VTDGNVDAQPLLLARLPAAARATGARARKAAAGKKEADLVVVQHSVRKE